MCFAFRGSETLKKRVWKGLIKKIPFRIVFAVSPESLRRVPVCTRARFSFFSLAPLKLYFGLHFGKRLGGPNSTILTLGGSGSIFDATLDATVAVCSRPCWAWAHQRHHVLGGLPPQNLECTSPSRTLPITSREVKRTKQRKDPEHTPLPCYAGSADVLYQSRKTKQGNACFGSKTSNKLRKISVLFQKMTTSQECSTKGDHCIPIL